MLADCFGGVLRNLTACVELNPSLSTAATATATATASASARVRVCYQDWAEERLQPPPHGIPARDVSGAEVRVCVGVCVCMCVCGSPGSPGLGLGLALTLPPPGEYTTGGGAADTAAA